MGSGRRRARFHPECCPVPSRVSPGSIPGVARFHLRCRPVPSRVLPGSIPGVARFHPGCCPVPSGCRPVPSRVLPGSTVPSRVSPGLAFPRKNAQFDQKTALFRLPQIRGRLNKLKNAQFDQKNGLVQASPDPGMAEQAQKALKLKSLRILSQCWAYNTLSKHSKAPNLVFDLRRIRGSQTQLQSTLKSSELVARSSPCRDA